MLSSVCVQMEPEKESLVKQTPKPHKSKSWWLVRGSPGLVLLYSFCLLFTSVGNSVYFKFMTTRMSNYPIYLSQVINLIYIPIFFGLVEYEKRFTRYITLEMRQFPQWKFLLMGAADGLAEILALFGSIHTSG